MALNIGMIGTGWFSKVHADILSNMDGVNVAAFVGTSQEKAEAAVKNYATARA
ncbi:Gfo/Idh/MocA family oxidoreductase, partial [Mycobacterium kansasii]